MNIWERRLRLYSGLVMSIYVIQHLINHGLGVVSFDAMEDWREFWSPIWGYQPIKILLYASFLVHIYLALQRLYQRRTLRMPRWEMLQMLFGLALAPLLIGHMIGTRFVAELGGISPDYYYVVTAVALKPRFQLQMPVLLLITWMHVVFGLHFWLRLSSWYRKSYPVWVILAVAIPSVALAGLLQSLVTAQKWVKDPEALGDIFYEYNEIPEALRLSISSMEAQSLWIGLILLLLTLLARQVRQVFGQRTSAYKVRHSNGKTVSARRGQTLLEAIRLAGIRHASVCGGRGRCTTCRVRVGVGLEHLSEPGEIERQALARIGADPNVRLACQLRPDTSIAITPLVNVQHETERVIAVPGGVQGEEREVVCMFVDMRGSTRMGERILPYDVVFILNQFFSELSNALDETNGYYSQFMGDGLMALYGLNNSDSRQAAKDALRGAVLMFERLEALNSRLKPEFGQKVKMGVGIHGGVAIVGQMGPPSTPALSAIGDNINITARLESLTKTEQCDVIVSAEILKLAGLEVSQEDLKVVEVRGRVDGIEAGLWKIEQLRSLIN
ncbi:MAG: adenylate cyclase [Parasphingorhabdus sp.]|jgi:adenylate cyclase